MRGNEYNLQQGSYNHSEEKFLHNGSGYREAVFFRREEDSQFALSSLI